MALLVKHALKVAIGATLLGAIFQQSESVAIIHYPAMGLTATMQSSLGGTLKAAWGRLGGSVVGGIMGGIFLGIWGGNPITSGIAFVCAALFCDFFQLPSLFNQAGVIGALIAASAIGHGDNPWVYTFHRVLDNGIGVAIGTLITVIFWTDNPRQTLVDNYSQVLANFERLLEDIMHNFLRSEKVNLEDLFFQSRNQIQRNLTLLDQSMYGWKGHQIARENWSELLAIQKRILRYLTVMFNLSKKFNNPRISNKFQLELFQFSQQISSDFKEISQALKINQGSPVFPTINLEEQFQHINQKLMTFQSNSLNDHELLVDILQFYAFLDAFKKLSQELEQLSLERKKTTLAKPKFSFKSISNQRLSYILKTGVVISLSLAVLENFLHLPYSFYAIIGIIIAMRPTLGKGINAGLQRGLMTLVGALYAFLIINTLGSNYLTLGLGVFLVVMTGAYLGFTQGYHAGCFPVIIAILAHTAVHNSYIWGRLSETIIGVIIGIIASLIFGFETSANKLDKQFVKVFKDSKSLYTLILNDYTQQTDSGQAIQESSQKIRQLIQSQNTLQAETKREPTDELMASKKQRLWNYLSNAEINILRHLFYLDTIVKNQKLATHPQEFFLELKAIMTVTIQGFDYLIKAIDCQTKQPSIQLLYPYLALEEKLLKKQQQLIKSESLEKETDFFVILSTLKEITTIVEETIQNFPA